MIVGGHVGAAERLAMILDHRAVDEQINALPQGSAQRATALFDLLCGKIEADDMWHDEVLRQIQAAVSLYGGARGGRIELAGLIHLFQLDTKPADTAAAFAGVLAQGPAPGCVAEAVRYMSEEQLVLLKERNGMIPACLLWLRRNDDLPREVETYLGQLPGFDWQKYLSAEPQDQKTLYRNGYNSMRISRIYSP